MRRFIKVTLIILATSISFVACLDNDDNITPSGNYSPIRGGFPQGDSELDDIIYQIKQDYGVYLLYKDIREEDINRTWVSAGTGNIIVAGDEAERNSISWSLPENQLEYYVNFFNDYIFPNITEDFAKKTFPVKIYMINVMLKKKKMQNVKSKKQWKCIRKTTASLFPMKFGQTLLWKVISTFQLRVSVKMRA